MALAFAVCEVCTHATLASCRVPRCRLCGGTLRAEAAPPRLAEGGWRCGCFQCVGTPC